MFDIINHEKIIHARTSKHERNHLTTRCGWALQAWIEEMSLFVKALDPLHMLTVGEEGFYSSTCARVHLNPGSGSRRTGIASSPWALMEGQDFLANHAVRPE